MAQVALRALFLHDPSRLAAYSLRDAVLLSAAATLVLALTYLPVVYRLKLRAWYLKRGEARRSLCWSLLADDSRLMGSLQAPGDARLRAQIVFLFGRFAPHAPLWQYVIWARSLGLILTAFLVPVLFETDTVDPNDIGYDSRGAVWVSVCVQMALAATIVLAALVATLLVHPYSYLFQNTLDKALVGCALLLIILGGVYTFATDTNSQNRLVVEFVMLGLMLGTVAASLLFLLHIFRKQSWELVASVKDQIERRVSAAAKGPRLSRITVEASGVWGGSGGGCSGGGGGGRGSVTAGLRQLVNFTFGPDAAAGGGGSGVKTVQDGGLDPMSLAMKWRARNQPSAVMAGGAAADVRGGPEDLCCLREGPIDLASQPELRAQLAELDFDASAASMAGAARGASSRCCEGGAPSAAGYALRRVVVPRQVGGVGIEMRGVIVAGVSGTAAAAGLVAVGDVVVAVNGRRVWHRQSGGVGAAMDPSRVENELAIVRRVDTGGKQGGRAVVTGAMRWKGPSRGSSSAEGFGGVMTNPVTREQPPAVPVDLCSLSSQAELVGALRRSSQVAAAAAKKDMATAEREQKRALRRLSRRSSSARQKSPMQVQVQTQVQMQTEPRLMQEQNSRSSCRGSSSSSAAPSVRVSASETSTDWATATRISDMGRGILLGAELSAGTKRLRGSSTSSSTLPSSTYSLQALSEEHGSANVSSLTTAFCGASSTTMMMRIRSSMELEQADVEWALDADTDASVDGTAESTSTRLHAEHANGLVAVPPMELPAGGSAAGPGSCSAALAAARLRRKVSLRAADEAYEATKDRPGRRVGMSTAERLRSQRSQKMLRESLQTRSQQPQQQQQQQQQRGDKHSAEQTSTAERSSEDSRSREVAMAPVLRSTKCRLTRLSLSSRTPEAPTRHAPRRARSGSTLVVQQWRGSGNGCAGVASCKMRHSVVGGGGGGGGSSAEGEDDLGEETLAPSSVAAKERPPRLRSGKSGKC